MLPQHVGDSWMLFERRQQANCAAATIDEMLARAGPTRHDDGEKSERARGRLRPLEFGSECPEKNIPVAM